MTRFTLALAAILLLTPCASGRTPDAAESDPILEQLSTLERSSAGAEVAPLWDRVDPQLQARTRSEVGRLGLDAAIGSKRLALALVDISDPAAPRVASLNGDVMMYAASLPKLAALLGAFSKSDEQQLQIDEALHHTLERMIQDSSNSAATEIMTLVGKQYIAQTLLAPRYRLYDPRRNGGLWLGKDYAPGGLWRRDPLHQISHGATAMQVARFYYLLVTEQLVNGEASRAMAQILSATTLRHRFVRVLDRIHPQAQILRKSGSWRGFLSDSVTVQLEGGGYILVALSRDNLGSATLEALIERLDRLIFPQPQAARDSPPTSRSVDESVWPASGAPRPN